MKIPQISKHGIKPCKKSATENVGYPEFEFEEQHNTILRSYQETIGPLLKVEEGGGSYARVRIGPMNLILPSGMASQMRSYIGQKVGVLRIEADYRFRILSNPDTPATEIAGVMAAPQEEHISLAKKDSRIKARTATEPIGVV
ncbi:MAG: hypothetical protein MUO26_00395 [Methanotrichaceae archaeon]|nr:hypothetical protein [Methanotrichaceae archaeon]